jgi:hypothetical protein
VARRHVPKVPVGDSLDPDPFDRVRGIGASLRWDSITNCSHWSRKCLRVPGERSPSLGHVTDVPRVIPDSPCSGRLSNPSEGPAFDPLISKGLGARVLWGSFRTPQGATFEPLISKGLGARVLRGGCRTPQGATFEPLISKGIEARFLR